VGGTTAFGTIADRIMSAASNTGDFNGAAVASTNLLVAQPDMLFGTFYQYSNTGSGSDHWCSTYFQKLTTTSVTLTANNKLTPRSKCTW